VRLDPNQFSSDEIYRIAPIERDKLIASSSFIRAWTRFEPSASHHRPRDSRPMPQSRPEIFEKRRRIRILWMRDNLKLVTHAPSKEGTPV
jgi:hypothetical protein